MRPVQSASESFQVEKQLTDALCNSMFGVTLVLGEESIDLP